MKKNLIELIQLIELIDNSKVYDVAVKSPLERSAHLSERFKNQIYIKREDLQPVFSFKIRGAYNKIASLSLQEQKRGIIAASAGNHAQGVALSAQKLCLKATIIMPKTTPTIKVDAVKAYGAEVILEGDNYDEAYDCAQELCDKKGLTFIHPYDDKDVIAGQGTIGKEILNQIDSNIHAIFIAVGGGGLISGVATYIKYHNPDIKIIGVEPENSDCMRQALAHNERIILDNVGIFADGVAVKQVGKLPFELAKTVIDDIITVSTDEICAAIKDIFDTNRTVAEPAGGVGLAGLKKYVKTHDIKQKNLITIECGANINFDRLRHVAERAEIGEEKEAIFAVTIPERPGSFKEFCTLIGHRSVTEFNYRYSHQNDAQVFVGIELKKGREERNAILKSFQNSNYPVVDLTDNEMAKIHVRHMVGGKANHGQHEKCYRVQFPEKPGALLNFLKQLGHYYNISLFHYRNHGADYGRVLLGIQIPPDKKGHFEDILTKVGYFYIDETDNPAFNLFL